MIKQTTYMDYPYGIKEIENRTGLKTAFINKCNRRLRDVLDQYRIEGDKGALLYSNDGMSVWDTIKQHKCKV